MTAEQLRELRQVCEHLEAWAEHEDKQASNARQPVEREMAKNRGANFRMLVAKLHRVAVF